MLDEPDSCSDRGTFIRKGTIGVHHEKKTLHFNFRRSVTAGVRRDTMVRKNAHAMKTYMHSGAAAANGAQCGHQTEKEAFLETNPQIHSSRRVDRAATTS